MGAPTEPKSEPKRLVVENVTGNVARRREAAYERAQRQALLRHLEIRTASIKEGARDRS